MWLSVCFCFQLNPTRDNHVIFCDRWSRSRNTIACYMLFACGQRNQCVYCVGSQNPFGYRYFVLDAAQEATAFSEHNIHCNKQIQSYMHYLSKVKGRSGHGFGCPWPLCFRRVQPEKTNSFSVCVGLFVFWAQSQDNTYLLFQCIKFMLARNSLLFLCHCICCCDSPPSVCGVVRFYSSVLTPVAPPPLPHPPPPPLLPSLPFSSRSSKIGICYMYVYMYVCMYACMYICIPARIWE